MNHRMTLASVLVFCFGLLGGCGGGGGGGSSTPAPPISGHVTFGGLGLSGVTLTLTGAASATTTTNSSGSYRFTGLADGAYTVTPSRTGFTFSPATAPITVAGGSTTQAFTATIDSAIAGGGGHSLTLKNDGTVRAWGYNAYGQLGDGSTTTRLTPVAVSGLTQVIAIAVGEQHSLALKSDGTVRAWGRNNYGQLGDGSTTTRLTPVAVSGLTQVIAIAVGEQHSLALKSDGTVRAWGRNNYGQLGNNTTTDSDVPVTVSGLTGVISAVAAGGGHSLALKSDGTAVWAWGGNAYGQLGDGSTTNSPSPVTVSGLTGVISAVAAGGGHSLALKSDGTAVWAWGSNAYGQLGDGSTTNSPSPVTVSGLTGVISAVAAGGGHSLALKSDGTAVWAWGSNAYGQLGDGSTTNSPSPVTVSGLTGVISAVAAGGGHSLALKSDGTAVWAWGSNAYGQLGDGSTTNSPSPVTVSAF